MFQMKLWAAVMFVAAVGYALPLQADNPTTQPTVMSDQGMMFRSDSLIGSKVMDTQGNRLGTVHDVVLTSDFKKVSYVVLSHGGTLGIGDKFFAVPLSALQIKTKWHSRVDSVVLNVSNDTLDRNPGFDMKNWPSMPDTNLFKPMGEMAKDQAGTQMGITNYQKVRKLVGLDVRNNSEKLGDISYLIVNDRNGRIPFAVISFGGLLGMREKFATVPWESIQVQEDKNIAFLQTTKGKLESMEFTRRSVPDFSGRQYATKVYETFGVTPYWEGGAPTARVTAVSFEAWKPESDYNKLYDMKKISTVSGTIESVGTFYPVEGAAPGLLLNFKTDKGETFVVHAGPSAFAKSKNLTFANGDKITVTGSPVRFKNESILMACEIKRGNDTLMLRDKDGKILWDVNQLQKHEEMPGK